jgi:hypothetical protein
LGLVALITIGGVELPTPSDFSVSYQDISKAERNANGLMIIERIATKRKLAFTYAYLTEVEASLILRTIAPTFYTVVYLDPQTKTMKSGSFYCGDRDIGVLDYINGVARFKELTFNLIER